MLVRWGIISTARINHKFIAGARQSSALEILAVASRQRYSAERYAADNGIERAYGGYDALLADPDIDAVYISLPNSMHVEWTVKALEAGKHVLCEKPMGRRAADVQMAFDNSLVTRWRTWQRAEPGMFVEVDFGQAQAADSVTVETSDEGYQTNVELEGMDSSGNWTTLSKNAQETTSRPALSLRRAAAAELKARGIRYVIVEREDLRSDDFQAYTALWGMKLAGETAQGRLYYIE